MRIPQPEKYVLNGYEIHPGEKNITQSWKIRRLELF